MQYDTITDEATMTALDGPCPPDAPTDAEQAPDAERYRSWIAAQRGRTRRILTIAEIIATVSPWDAREIARFKMCIMANHNPPKARNMPGLADFQRDPKREELSRLIKTLNPLRLDYVIGWLSAARNATAQPALMAPGNRNWRADVDSLAGGVR